MITRFRNDQKLPYSLHDMRVSRICFDGDSVVLQFEKGFVKAIEPYPQVPGNIRIERADADFTYAVLLNEYGKYGEIRGNKLSLMEFTEKYRDCSFEITDELHGYNQIEYGGYLYTSESKTPVEMMIYVYHWGDIVYETEE